MDALGERLAAVVAHNKSTPPTATAWHYLAGVNFEPLWARFTARPRPEEGPKPSAGIT
jgi:hypothetical protein